MPVLSRAPHRLRRPHRRRLAPLVTVTVAALAAAAPVAVVASPSAAAPGRTLHVDCSAAPTGKDNGTAKRPFTSLEQVNALTLRPRTTVAFRRGTTCAGTLAPSGTGARDAPVTFTAYGTGSRPVIDGQGAPDAIRIRNMEWVTLEKLEVTNAANPGTKRRGVTVDLENYGKAEGLVVRDLYIHDVWGDDAKDTNGSGGLYFRVLGTERASWFENVIVQGNRIEDVDRTGINLVASVWRGREDINRPDLPPWTPSRNVRITGNTVTNTGGDGIVMTQVDGGLMDYNKVHKFQMRSSGWNAGIWPWNSDNVTIRYNESSGGNSTVDGMGFDIDEGTNNTVVEYNYSHDNDGGFMLICTAEGTITGAVVRYNISQNDSYRGLEMCSGSIGDAKVYNNTIYIGDGVSQTVINENTTRPHNIAFENNIVVKEGAGSATMNLRPNTRISLSDNTFWNVTGVPANPGGMTADPRFIARGTGPQGYRLHETSPVLDTGKAIADDVTRDWFGNPVPLSGPVNAGAYEGDGVSGPVPSPVELTPFTPADAGSR
ncbi:parallel beta helix pectate lyase-like protein [Knoellia remsis]|uniref:Parallel beta helix pectate lyase-like protein n=1 Tax=Knoellia remsis TaxID=407159 RepID=A0A2T0UZP3_9MICO|nr:right-handed parallel beta-helix repeat-containing protein [Knoellia remsis]PRY63366.1 parallel beta helix pectate lyase-like protein [Knoellia remsis]